jgi:hypothetical protein
MLEVGRRQTGIRSLADQITLKFRQCAENMKHQLAARRGRVDGFSHAMEANRLILQPAHYLDQMLRRPPQPVESPHRQHIAPPEHFVHPLQAGVLHLATAGCLLDDPLAP